MMEDDEMFDAPEEDAAKSEDASADEMFSDDEVFDSPAGSTAEASSDDALFDEAPSEQSQGGSSDDALFDEPADSSSTADDDMMFDDAMPDIASAPGSGDADASGSADASSSPETPAEAEGSDNTAEKPSTESDRPADLLSDGEIDALMETVDGASEDDGSSDDGEYRRVDFGAREHSVLREFTVLGSLIERHAELLAAALEDAFSLEFTVRSGPTTLLRVTDALAGMERAVGVTTTTLSPLKGPIFVVSPTSLLSNVVNAYFGGSAVMSPKTETKIALTPTELRVAERIANMHLQCLCSAWLDKLPLEIGDAATLGMPDRLEMVPRTELLLRIRLSLGLADSEAPLDLMLPFRELEPYKDRFRPPRKSDKEVNIEASWEPFFRRELPSIKVEVSGTLATKTMALADVMELTPGAVIPLSPPEDVSIHLDGLLVAEGQYGSHEGMKAVKINTLGSMLREA